MRHIGENPDRDGLKETPSRVVRSWDELFSGYEQDPAEVMKTFEEDSDEMVFLADVPFYSTCEHHMLTFSGKAFIAYLPNGRVIGASKLARILEIYARRLQVQERICKQVTKALMKHLKPKGAACVIKAEHLCISCRGVQKAGSVMGASSMVGAFREDQSLRYELMMLMSM